MKKLKTKYLYKLLIILIINILFKNIYIFSFSILLLLAVDLKKSYMSIFLLIIIVIVSSNKTDFIRYGFVDVKTDKYIIVNKILYKDKIYNTKFDVGDIVSTSNYELIDSESDLKNNILYSCGSCNKLFTNIFKNNIYKYINSKENSGLYKNIFYNIYDEESADLYDNLSFGLTFYYLIMLVFKRNNKLGLLLIFIYSFLFGFQIKFILIIIDFILTFLDLDKIESLFLKILFISIINKYLLLNYSFLLGIIISFIYLYNSNINVVIIGLIQSLLFGEVKIFNVIFYKAYIYEKISLFIFAALSLIFNFLEKPFITYSNILDKIFYYISLSIRGKICIFAIIIYLFITYLFKVKNNLIKYIVFLILLVVPFNSFITSVNFIDVGQGDAILINDSSDLSKILIDTGSKYNYSKLKKELFNNGIYTIDYLIITHDDSDHNGNIENLKKDFKIKNIILEGEDISTKNIFLDFLPLSDNELLEDNDKSLVYYSIIDGYAFLFTGDLSSNLENNIIFNHNINDIDILKVSHHGSKTASSNYFIGNIKPEIAVISTSGQYGHPHKQVLDTLDKFSVKTYITKNNGNIKFHFTKFIDFISLSKGGFDIIIK